MYSQDKEEVFNFDPLALKILSEKDLSKRMLLSLINIEKYPNMFIQTLEEIYSIISENRKETKEKDLISNLIKDRNFLTNEESKNINPDSLKGFEAMIPLLFILSNGELNPFKELRDFIPKDLEVTKLIAKCIDRAYETSIDYSIKDFPAGLKKYYGRLLDPKDDNSLEFDEEKTLNADILKLAKVEILKREICYRLLRTNEDLFFFHIMAINKDDSQNKKERIIMENQLHLQTNYYIYKVANEMNKMINLLKAENEIKRILNIKFL